MAKGVYKWMNDADAWINFPGRNCITWLDICRFKCMEVSHLSVITCFLWGFAVKEMTVNACHNCFHSGTLLKPTSGIAVCMAVTVL